MVKASGFDPDITGSIPVTPVFLFPLDRDLKALGGVFRKNGHSLYVVGGAVRDAMLGSANLDVDLATSATPDEMLSMFPRSIKTGLKHGTLTIPFRGKHYETTTFRIDDGYSDSRHPDKVIFGKSLSGDLSRRDFTINAMAADTETGELTDLYGGADDLKRRIIRTVGNPSARFSEDALRLFRAVRFAAVLDFDMERETYAALCEKANGIESVSVERIQSEIEKMFSPRAVNVSRGLGLLLDSGLLRHISPVLSDSLSGGGVELVSDMLSEACGNEFPMDVKLAVLLYRVSDPVLLMKGLKFGNRVTGAVREYLVATRMVCASGDPDASLIKKIAGGLKYGDCSGLGLLWSLASDCESAENASAARLAADRMRVFLERKEPYRLSDLAVSGDDLVLAGMNGAEVGAVLMKMLDAVRMNPAMNSREALLGEFVTEGRGR